MKKFLSRDDVDKLLNVDKDEKIPTFEEIKRIREEIQKLADSKGLKPEDLPQSEINMVLKSIGLDKVKIYTEAEIKGDK